MMLAATMSATSPSAQPVGEEPGPGAEVRAAVGEGMAALGAGDLDTALSRLEAARDLAPGDVGVLLALSQVHEARGEIEQAVAVAREAAGLAPEAVAPVLAVGALEARSGHMDEALVALEKARQLGPDNALVHVLSSAALVEVGRRPEAISILGDALDRGVADGVVIEQLGYLLLQDGSFEEALEVVDRGLAASGPTGGLSLVKGLALAALPDRRNQAAGWLEDALVLGVENRGAAHLELAALRLEEGRAEDAVTHLREAEALAPEAAAIQFRLAEALDRAGDSEGAAIARERFTELGGSSPASPRATDPELLAALEEAQKLAGENRFEAALESADAVAARWGPNPGVLVLRSKILYALGRVAPALEAATQARSLDPRLAEPHYLEGLYLSQAGRPAEAETALRRAIGVDPNLGPAQALLGASLSKQGRPAEAITHFERALELGSDGGFLRLGYAGALETLGREDEAAEQMEAYRRLSSR